MTSDPGPCPPDIELRNLAWQAIHRVAILEDLIGTEGTLEEHIRVVDQLLAEVGTLSEAVTALQKFMEDSYLPKAVAERDYITRQDSRRGRFRTLAVVAVVAIAGIAGFWRSAVLSHGVDQVRYQSAYNNCLMDRRTREALINLVQVSSMPTPIPPGAAPALIEAIKQGNARQAQFVAETIAALPLPSCQKVARGDVPPVLPRIPH